MSSEETGNLPTLDDLPKPIIPAVLRVHADTPKRCTNGLKRVLGREMTSVAIFRYPSQDVGGGPTRDRLTGRVVYLTSQKLVEEGVPLQQGSHVVAIRVGQGVRHLCLRFPLTTQVVWRWARLEKFRNT
jgi:hypothetical protein